MLVGFNGVHHMLDCCVFCPHRPVSSSQAQLVLWGVLSICLLRLPPPDFRARRWVYIELYNTLLRTGPDYSLQATILAQCCSAREGGGGFGNEVGGKMKAEINEVSGAPLLLPGHRPAERSDVCTPPPPSPLPQILPPPSPPPPNTYTQDSR